MCNIVCDTSMLRCRVILCIFLFFFFQAEDGIRDRDVTGVQTCALQISARSLAPARISFLRAIERKIVGPSSAPAQEIARAYPHLLDGLVLSAWRAAHRSEERRVGKEGRARIGTDAQREKKNGED